MKGVYLILETIYKIFSNPATHKQKDGPTGVKTQCPSKSVKAMIKIHVYDIKRTMNELKTIALHNELHPIHNIRRP